MIEAQRLAINTGVELDRIHHRAGVHAPRHEITWARARGLTGQYPGTEEHGGKRKEQGLPGRHDAMTGDGVTAKRPG